MANSAYFSFDETDREIVSSVREKVLDVSYAELFFPVADLLQREDTDDTEVMKKVVAEALKDTSRTIVFVGNNTYKSKWVPLEVDKTLDNGKAVYAIRLQDKYGIVPPCLINNGISIYSWSEKTLQYISIR